MAQVQGSPASCPFLAPPSHQNSSNCPPAMCPPACPPSAPCTEKEGVIQCQAVHSPACPSSGHHCIEDQSENQTHRRGGNVECLSIYDTISAAACRWHIHKIFIFFIIMLFCPTSSGCRCHIHHHLFFYQNLLNLYFLPERVYLLRPGATSLKPTSVVALSFLLRTSVWSTWSWWWLGLWRL